MPLDVVATEGVAGAQGALQIDLRALCEGAERYTPFALQLALLADRREADLTARAALAEFYKFRGFLAGDRARKIALYQEALRFNPANANVPARGARFAIGGRCIAADRRL